MAQRKNISSLGPAAEKQCVICDEVKPLTDFSLTPAGNPRHRCKACRANQQDSEVGRERRLMRVYGITHADYVKMLEEQGGHCACCPTTPEDTVWGWLDIDHNHDTGEVRGLLCNPCNRALGLSKDNPQTVENWVDYLKTRGSYG
jgi:hypothetical protein